MEHFNVTGKNLLYVLVISIVSRCRTLKNCIIYSFLEKCHMHWRSRQFHRNTEVQWFTAFQNKSELTFWHVFLIMIVRAPSLYGLAVPSLSVLPVFFLKGGDGTAPKEDLELELAGDSPYFILSSTELALSDILRQITTVPKKQLHFKLSHRSSQQQKDW